MTEETSGYAKAIAIRNSRIDNSTFIPYSHDMDKGSPNDLDHSVVKCRDSSPTRGGKGMRKHQQFLIPWSVLFLFIEAFCSSAQENLPAIVKRIEPSAVIILTYDKEGKALGQGSGFFYSKDGDVITNRHVLLGASRAEVKTAEGKVYPVTQIVAEDKEGDLIRASVDIPRKAVRSLSVSDSLPETGEKVIVIGSPLGLERTVTDGIVSAVREIPGFGEIIQITAPISQGSSGSPVVNMKGEVIGVATFLMIEGQSLNFAIPGERVVRLAPGKGRTLAEWKAGKAEEWLASAEGLYFTGLTFIWTEDYENALPYFEKAVKKNSRYAEAYFQVGYCRAELGHYREAIDAFKQAIRIKPDYAEAHYNLGVAYGNPERWGEAIEAFKQAIRIKPDFAEAHYNLGGAYGELGHHQEEIEAYKQAIRIKPDYAEAHFGLGVVYFGVGDRGSALDEYKILKDLDKDLANELFNTIYQ